MNPTAILPPTNRKQRRERMKHLTKQQRDNLKAWEHDKEEKQRKKINRVALDMSIGARAKLVA